MSRLKKFGTFSGVFTPSILTILGVIMYLRFPAIIGQTGLINTIAIVIVAHIISITTSLSVASLSTDKPVQNGGTYFMISRSLGLPIGGTLGYALFVGLSFSVSLYLIGFAESFLQYWELDSSIQSIRITGTAILLVVTTITFISTSLAIKSQYFIMAAIGLSLLSIFFGKHDFAPETVNLKPLADSAPFMLLFGIFFPAVTGFEAGVSMSGDLKNAKRSLPLGAIMAVAVGFVAYVLLAVFYAYTVDAEVLANDPAVLFKISLFPQLVIAGIWGATLSSALGSILGAPRILQAIAQDRLSPRFFAKTTKKANEPRNALLLAFIIAEAGILIGELDVIARIVSMFFITTYAFLNLASFIESWSSSDFRPAFKIPRWVSLLGAVSAFFVMVLLDFVALAGATVVLVLLYVLLQRKQMVLSGGDVWGSFWANLAKKALLRLSAQKIDKRNWRPNILMFSTQNKHNRYLVDTGLAMTGKLGALTDFIIRTDKSVAQTAENAKNDKGNRFFIREFVCDSDIEGIKSVTSVYGFSGFEPNTVLLEWERDEQRAGYLLELIKDFRQKKLNAVFLDYEGNAAFGKRQQIDIWWNGKGKLLSFSLQVLRFLLSDKKWRDTHLRIFMLDDEVSQFERYKKFISALLAEKRMKASFEIINSKPDKQAVTNNINEKSAYSDLVIIGISTNPAELDEDYIADLCTISRVKPSVLLLSPSDDFEEVNIIQPPVIKDNVKQVNKTDIRLPDMPAIGNSIFSSKLVQLETDFDGLLAEIEASIYIPVISPLQSLLSGYSELYKKYLLNDTVDLKTKGSDWIRNRLQTKQRALLKITESYLKTQRSELASVFTTVAEKGTEQLENSLLAFIDALPEEVFIEPNDNKNKKHEALFFQKAVCLKMEAFHLLAKEQNSKLIKLLRVAVSVVKFSGYKTRTVLDSFSLNNDEDLKTVEQELDKIYNNIVDAIHETEEFIVENRRALLFAVRRISIDLAKNCGNDHLLKKLNQKARKVKAGNFSDYYDDIQNWAGYFEHFYGQVYLDCLLLSMHAHSVNVFHKAFKRIDSELFKPLTFVVEKIVADEQGALGSLDKSVFADSYLKDACKNVNDLLLHLPEKVSFLENEVYTTVDVRKVGLFYFESSFRDAVAKQSASLDQQFRVFLKEYRSIRSLFRFEELNKNDVVDDHFDRVKKQLLHEYEKLESNLKQSNSALSDAVDAFYKSLQTDNIITYKREMPAHRREERGQIFAHFYESAYQRIQWLIRFTAINSLHLFSRGLLWTKKQGSKPAVHRTNLGDILNMSESLIPLKDEYEKLPAYYRGLFNTNSLINDDLWVERKKEQRLLMQAYERHMSGFGGAVFVTGVQGSGKTALCRNFVQERLAGARYFWLELPADRACSFSNFEQALALLTNMPADWCYIMENIPQGTILVIDDLELWWEDTPNGADFIKKVIEMIAEYGRKVLFLINCNSFFYRRINDDFPVYLNTLLEVECEPFNAKQIQQLVMKRQFSSGLELVSAYNPASSISPVKLSILFNSIFSISQGIPSATLEVWKSIVSYDKSGLVYIKNPQLHNETILNKLENEFVKAISLFLLHKSLNINQYQKLLNKSEEDARSILGAMVNAGLVVQNANGYFMIRSALIPYLVTEK